MSPRRRPPWRSPNWPSPSPARRSLRWPDALPFAAGTTTAVPVPDRPGIQARQTTASPVVMTSRTVWRGLSLPCGHRSRRGRRADSGTAQHRVAVVEDGSLPPRYAAGGAAQPDADGVAVQPGGAGVDLAVRAKLDEAVAGLLRGDAAGPYRARGSDLDDVEALGRAYRDRPGHRLDVEDVAGLAVTGRGADPQAPALADGEGVGAFVLAQHGAVGVDDLTRGVAEVLGQEPARVAVGDEADVMAVGLVRDG